MAETHTTYRLVTKDDELVNRLVADIERFIAANGGHECSYKVVPGVGDKYKGFTRHVYLHLRSKQIAGKALAAIAGLAQMDRRETHKE